MPPINALEVLAAMISPAVLMAAGSSVVLSTSNRLGRVVDRVRLLMKDAQRLEQASPETETPAESAEHDLILEQLDYCSRRMNLLRSALAGLYASLALLVLTSLLIGLFVVVKGEAGWMPLGTGLAGAVAFLFSMLQLVREAAWAVIGTQNEMQFISQLLAKRRPPQRKH
jgi:hypothetical protein